MAIRITLLQQWTAIVRNFSDHFSLKTWLRSNMKQQRFSNLTVLNCHKKLTESLDVIQIANTFAGRNENRMKNFGIFTMPTYKEQQTLDKVCKVTRQKQIKYHDFIPFFDFQYEKIIFNCQPSHFSPCSAVPGQVTLFFGYFNFLQNVRRLVSSVGRAQVCWAGGRGLKPRPKQLSGSLNNWGESAAFEVTSAID